MLLRPAFLVAAAVAVLAGSAIGRATQGPPRAGPVVVAVEARGLQTATGFVVGGRVVTVAHAVGDGPVVVRDSRGGTHPARLVRRDEELDVALLAVPALHDEGPPVLGGPRLLVRRDGTAVAEPVVVRRRVDARVRDAATDAVAHRAVLELAGDVRAGDSGAPVLDGGRIAGIVFARSRDRERIAYALDAIALPGFVR
jgi:S1-C subfamily serine protease